MRIFIPIAVLLCLAALAGVGLFLLSMGTAEQAESPTMRGTPTFEGPPPPCFSSWDEAAGAGFLRPGPNAEHAVIVVADPTPTDGPPFDMAKTPPPPGFTSWDEVIASWIELNRQGFFDLPPTTPELDGPPPPGCSTWEQFIQWLEEWEILPPVQLPDS